MLRLILFRLLESFFRHPLLYCAIPVIMAMIAAVYLFIVPPEYEASGKFYVVSNTLIASLTNRNESGSAWGAPPAQTTAKDLQELLQTRAFVTEVINRTPLRARLAQSERMAEETYDEFDKAISVQYLGDNLVEVSASHKNRQLSRLLVDSVMTTYIDWKKTSERKENEAALVMLEELLRDYEQERSKAESDLNTFVTTHREPVVGNRDPKEQNELDSLKRALTNVEERIEEVKKNLVDTKLNLTRAASIVDQTYNRIDDPVDPPPARISLRNVAKIGGLFVAVGIMLSVIGIVLGALLDQSLRFPIDVQQQLGLPVLAMLPSVDSREWSALLDPKQAAREAKERSSHDQIQAPSSPSAPNDMPTS